MLSKPFRSPLLKHTGYPRAEAGDNNDDHAAKRRRISTDLESSSGLSGPRLIFKTPGVSSLPRKPLVAVQNPAATASTEDDVEGSVDGYYNVLWCE